VPAEQPAAKLLYEWGDVLVFHNPPVVIVRTDAQYAILMPDTMRIEIGPQETAPEPAVKVLRRRTRKVAS